MPRILIFGAYGMLGTSLSPMLVLQGHTVFKQGRANTAEYSVDPTDSKAVTRLVTNLKPDVIINLIAMTNVDGCERDVLGAFKANTSTVKAIADASIASSSKLMHISTDQVYDGDGPHIESDISPCNVYGLSKYAGELAANTCEATILRTNFVGRSNLVGRLAFTDWLVESFRQHESITLFEDVFFNALHISDLCKAIELVISRPRPGIFNVGSTNGLSKADFALGLASRLNLAISNVTIGKYSASGLGVRRPLDMRMDISRFEKEFGFCPSNMEQTLDSVAQDYLELENV